MSIETTINDVIQAKLDEGIIEKLVAENLEKGINKSLENLLGNYGDVTKLIQEKIKEVMVLQLSSYDYSKYVVKLDFVLTEILKKTSLDNKQILENFKELMTESDFPKVVELSDIFEKYKKFVAENIDTSDLEVIFEDGPSYENVSVTMEVEHEDQRSWASFKYAKVVFECEKDGKLNFEIRLSKFQEYPWSLSLTIDSSIESLRYLDKFKIYLMKLNQSGSRIDIDSNYLQEEIEVESKPEPEFR